MRGATHKTTSAAIGATLVLLCGLSSASAQEPDTTAVGKTLDGKAGTLGNARVPATRRHLNAAVDVFDLGAGRAITAAEKVAQPDLFGFVEPAPAGLRGQANWTPSDNGKYWSLEFVAANATGLRVKLNGAFGDGVELRVYDPESGSTFGPYTQPRLDENSDWWTPMIFGEKIGLEFHAPDDVDSPKLPEIRDIVRYTEDFGGGSTTGLGCGHNDISCTNDWANQRDAVCFMAYTSGGGGFVCTGALINRTPGDLSPLLLTADHCINTQAEANSLTCTWFFETPSCNGTPPNPNTLPQTNGSLLLKRRPNSDMSLLGLFEPPAANWYLGWNSGGWLLQSDAVGIHHPGGTFKRISDGDVTAALWVTYGLNNAHVWRVNWDNGSTEGGSSGSPVLDTSGRIRGQLKGGNCGRGDFGRFGVSFDTIDPYIDSVASPVYVQSGFGGTERGTSGSPFNSVYEATFCVIAGDTVRIRGGTYNESFTLWRPMLLTSENGSATIGG